MNQMNMFLKDGTTQQYIEDTLEPIASRSLFRNDQYFFYLCLMQKYARESCPSYLSEEGFKILKVCQFNGSDLVHVKWCSNAYLALS
jgi:betaine lipid synthase